jgi:hypothetical protein
MDNLYDPSEVAILINLGLTLSVDYKISCACNYFLSHTISYSNISQFTVCAQKGQENSH